MAASLELRIFGKKQTASSQEMARFLRHPINENLQKLNPTEGGDAKAHWENAMAAASDLVEFRQMGSIPLGGEDYGPKSGGGAKERIAGAWLHFRLYQELWVALSYASRASGPHELSSLLSKLHGTESPLGAIFSHVVYDPKFLEFPEVNQELERPEKFFLDSQGTDLRSTILRGFVINARELLADTKAWEYPEFLDPHFLRYIWVFRYLIFGHAQSPLLENLKSQTYHSVKLNELHHFSLVLNLDLHSPSRPITDLERDELLRSSPSIDTFIQRRSVGESAVDILKAMYLKAPERDRYIRPFQHPEEVLALGTILLREHHRPELAWQHFVNQGLRRRVAVESHIGQTLIEIAQRAVIISSRDEDRAARQEDVHAMFEGMDLERPETAGIIQSGLPEGITVKEQLDAEQSLSELSGTPIIDPVSYLMREKQDVILFLRYYLEPAKRASFFQRLAKKASPGSIPHRCYESLEAEARKGPDIWH